MEEETKFLIKISFYKDINSTHGEEADHNHLSENLCFDVILLRVRNSAHEWGGISSRGGECYKHHGCNKSSGHADPDSGTLRTDSLNKWELPPSVLF